MRGAAIAGLLALAIALAVPALYATERLSVALNPHCSWTDSGGDSVSARVGTLTVQGVEVPYDFAGGAGGACAADTTRALTIWDGSERAATAGTWTPEESLPFAGVPASGLGRAALPALHALLMVGGVASLILLQVGNRTEDEIEDG